MTKILVVDDDDDILEMMCLILESYNLTPTCVPDGKGIREIIDDINPALILMDIYLGKQDGRTICHSLKESAIYGHIPIILYSAGHISSESIKASLADAFIVKPFNVQELVNQIKLRVQETIK